MRWRKGTAYGSFVYVLLGSHGMVKIGHSKDPVKRRAELQTGSAHHLSLVHAAVVNGDAEAAEEHAHELLWKHRQEGEWFAVPVDVAVAAVGAAVFRFSEPADASIFDRKPSRLLPVAYATGLTPILLCRTPAPFIVFAFAALTIGLFHLIRMRPPANWSYFFRLVGMYTGATLAALAASALAFPLSAKAEGAIPKYDASEFCANAMATLSADDNEFLKNACIENEHKMLGQIERVWSSAPSDLRDTCLKQVKLTAHSYIYLSGCLSGGVGNMWMDGKVRITKP